MAVRLSATPLGAGLSGAGFGLVMPWLHGWLPGLGLSDAASRLAVASSLLLLFFVPVMLLVVGIRHLSYGARNPDPGQFRASRAQVGIRALCWLAGAGGAFGAAALVRGLALVA